MSGGSCWHEPSQAHAHSRVEEGFADCRVCAPAGKTLLARAIANNIDANFLKVVSSAIVDKYIGESARLIREMFGYAREHQPCIIFMDEIDAIGGRRFSEGTSADREIQRTLMELLSQLDGFDPIGKVRIHCHVSGRTLPQLQHRVRAPSVELLPWALLW